MNNKNDNNLPNAQNPNFYEHDIDLSVLWSYMWGFRKWILIITIVFAIGSIIYSLSLVDMYRSHALLAPAENRQPNNSMISQLGVVASIAGINVGNNPGGNITSAIAIMESRRFISQFISSHDALPALVAGSWDEAEGRGEIDPAIFDEVTGTWPAGAPTDFRAFQQFRSIFSVAQNQNTGLVTVAIDWHDPELAKDWVSWIVEDINELVKLQDLEEATNAIEYLRQQLGVTQLVEMQRAFYQLIESQTRVVMLADVRKDYVFKVIDPAYVPEVKVSPNRSSIAIMGTLLGFAISLVLSIILGAIRKDEG